jgi:hypothetical protein
MATPKIQIDNTQLFERMKTLEDVTGKQVQATLRRGARLLAVNLAYSTPPYGTNQESLALGERAVQNDILKVLKPLYPTILKFSSKSKSFIEDIATLNNKRLQASMVKARGTKALQAIFDNAGGFSKLTVNSTADDAHDIYHNTRNNYGRVRKGWKARNIIADPGSVATMIRAKQALVGLTKAAWAAAAIKVNADVKNATSGIPAWVKRHMDAVPSDVQDDSSSMFPRIRLTSKVPWADKALRKADYDEAVRIHREKLFNSLETEIKGALKAQAAA